MKRTMPIFGQDYAPGYSIFIKDTGSFLGKGIVWFQSQQEACNFVATHVLIVVDSVIGIESSTHGIQPCFLDKYFNNIGDKNYEVVCREPKGIDEVAANQAIQYGKNEIGHMYDYIALFLGFPLMIKLGLAKRLGFLRKLPLPFHIPGARVCSAFVSDCYKHTDRYKEVKLFGWNVSRIDPVLLWNQFPYKPFNFEKQRRFIK